ncbi:MAG: lipopolysaccharide assembly protein LapB [Pseudomonadales bacterium]|nr:lipopolysaccharide assembly protein LapB [Pseudomonadales bacterium]
MNDINGLTLFFLLLLALAAAWYLGFQHRARRRAPVTRGPNRDYFIGLNFLLNDKPDQAIDTFINALQINSHTLETHMALGTLLRRRGKVDQAILLFQGLLAQSDLPASDLDQVKIELAKSYTAAGLYDRAERLLEELKNSDTGVKQTALALAVDVFQREREWQSAIETVNELLKTCSRQEKSPYQIMASQFCCELAEHEMQQGQDGQAREHLKKAFWYNRNNVRASLLAGELERQQGNHREAIKVLSKVSEQDGRFVSETFGPLLECYYQAGQEGQLQRFIEDSLKDNPASSVLLGIAQFIEDQSGQGAAITFLLQRLKQKSSLRIMDRLLALMQAEGNTPELEKIAVLHRVLNEYINTQAFYQCENCGYQAKNMHWLCPGCAQWEVVKPIQGATGE